MYVIQETNIHSPYSTSDPLPFLASTKVKRRETCHDLHLRKAGHSSNPICDKEALSSID
jgi:hypothetical protein